MPLNLKVTKENLQNGVVDEIKSSIEDLASSPSTIRSFENSVILNFEMTFEELFHALGSQEIKKWFKNLDAEIPYLPYFLSDGSDYTLTYYLMGSMDFSEKGNEVVFLPSQAKSFFKEKVRDIQNLCLPNNINPQPAIDRLSLSLGGIPESDQEKKPQQLKAESRIKKENKSKFETMLDKYGSFASVTGEERTRLFVVFDKKSENVSLSSFYLYPDKEEFPYFEITFKIDDSDLTFPVVAMYEPEHLIDSIEKWGGVFIEAFLKEDERYLKFFAIEQALKPEILFNNEEDSVLNVPDEKDTLIAQLQKELAALKEDLKKKDSVIEYYEAEMSKKKKGIFRKLFG